MRWREHLADPWGGLVAALAGGLTWAVIPDAALGVPLAVGVAAGVLGVKVAMGAWVDRPSAPEPPQPSLGAAMDVSERPPLGTPARGWVERAERAVRLLDELVGSAGAGATAERLGAVRDGARGTARAMRTLGRQVGAFDQALTRIDVDQLIAELTVDLDAMRAGLAEVDPLPDGTQKTRDRRNMSVRLVADISPVQRGTAVDEDLA